jgi:pyruvate dehydrogenase E2 component (dihydrolipoamide acetyltransferase)
VRQKTQNLEIKKMPLIDVKVPDIGDFKEVEVIELLVKPGDTIAADQSLATVESDKASMEIPSSHAGVVKELKIKLGDKISEGSLLLVLEAVGGSAAPAAVPSVSTLAMLSVATPAPASVMTQAAAATVARSTIIELLVPDIGDFDEVSVIEVFVKTGDTLKAEQSVITVESDKASMEIPSSHAGVIKELRVKLGDKIKKGSVMALLEAQVVVAVVASPVPAPAPTASAPLPAPAMVVGSSVASAPPAAHQPTVSVDGKLPHASPSIRKLARELGVPLAQVKGSGTKGRITHTDVQNFVKQVMAGTVKTQAQGTSGGATGGAGFPGLLAWPQVDFAKFGPVERKDQSRIKKISAANLHRNWVMIPHVTNHDDADITELENFRVLLNKENEKSGVKVTMLAFLIKACVAALKKFPEFNASLDGDQVVFKQYFHIGFAADTPNGLMVPVIKDADKKGVLQISAEMSELAKKARDGKLGPAEMTGGCFSISSLGGIGGRYFTPIINAPEVAILGVCRANTEPRWDGKIFEPRLMLPLSLSWDHRVIDGAAAARFNAYLGQILTDFRRVLL